MRLIEFTSVEYAAINWQGRRVQIEHQWISPERHDRPLLVYLQEAELPFIACPILAVQGQDEEHGTLEQIYSIARSLPQTQVLKLAACTHSPHRDQPAALISAVQESIDNHAFPGSSAPSS